ncbi:hypothetical protein FF38_09103 [Lucilia cuprina]|uniref:Uncharacterized protein n=1 Tax=Lucilia cuprina TaxID=7375 RepID=A0A0L0BSX2_LUCCU|nr:hypothetical protein FF38_09103 [Lucilia cuprina]
MFRNVKILQTELQQLQQQHYCDRNDQQRILYALLLEGYTISRSYPMRKPLKFWAITLWKFIYIYYKTDLIQKNCFKNLL